MQLGTVCHYDENGKFGFIEIPGYDRTVFFHNSRQRSFYCDLDAVIYDDGGWDSEPKKGDSVIVYAIQDVAKGPRATYWAKAETKKNAEQLLDMMLTYRLQHRDGREAISRLDPKPKVRTIWEGKNLLDLASFCERGYIRIEHNEFSYYYFEVLNTRVEAEQEIKDWERCGDPRP